jgi:hypothetical protein
MQLSQICLGYCYSFDLISVCSNHLYASSVPVLVATIRNEISLKTMLQGL